MIPVWIKTWMVNFALFLCAPTFVYTYISEACSNCSFQIKVVLTQWKKWWILKHQRPAYLWVPECQKYWTPKMQFNSTLMTSSGLFFPALKSSLQSYRKHYPKSWAPLNFMRKNQRWHGGALVSTARISWAQIFLGAFCEQLACSSCFCIFIYFFCLWLHWFPFTAKRYLRLTGESKMSIGIDLRRWRVVWMWSVV